MSKLKDRIEELKQELGKLPESMPDWNVLAELMSDISEDHYCAGWLISLEYTLWEAVIDNKREFGFSDIPAYNLYLLATYADKFGGWVVWDAAKGHKFVPMDAWLKMYEEDWKSKQK